MPPLDRLERLTDLVLVLLQAKRPLTLSELARDVPGYPEGRDARRQAFERDKRLLREEGIPVVTEPVDGPEQFGYRIDPDTFYLPDLHLTPDEQAALQLAVAGVHLGDPSGRDALAKLGATGLFDTRPLASLDPPPALVPLFEAVQRRALVRFRHRGLERQMTPAGLWFRRGHWYVVGWDADRQAPRSFRVDRIEQAPQLGPEGSGLLPVDFDPATAVPDEPWLAGSDDVAEVEVAVDAIEAGRVLAELGDDALLGREPDGSVRVRVRVTNWVGLITPRCCSPRQRARMSSTGSARSPLRHATVGPRLHLPRSVSMPIRRSPHDRRAVTSASASAAFLRSWAGWRRSGPPPSTR